MTTFAGITDPNNPHYGTVESSEEQRERERVIRDMACELRERVRMLDIPAPNRKTVLPPVPPRSTR